LAVSMQSRRPRVAQNGGKRRYAIYSGVLLAVGVVAVLFRNDLSHAFAFLWNATGWDISLTLLPYSVNDPYWWAFLVGLANTVAAGSLAIVISTLIGVVVGAAPLTQNAILTALARLYIDVVRNIPLILQAIFWYGIVLHLPPARSAIRVFNSIFLSSRGVVVPKFVDTPLVLTVAVAAVALLFSCVLLARAFVAGNWRTEVAGTVRTAVVALVAVAVLWLFASRVPAAVHIEWPTLAGLNFHGGFYLTPEFAALVIAITIYRGAFMAEIFRGGFASTSRGHIDAAKSLGLRPLQTLWTIRFPLALVHILPPISNEYINILKVTAIGIIIGFPDLFWVSSNAANQTGRPLQVVCIMIGLYLLMNFSLAALMNELNRRIRARGFQ
jgi:general L-amino acid transport system permease protein